VGTSARVEPSDEALVVRYERGDVGAFATLVRRHQTPVYHFLLRQVRSPAVAEELLQETFLRVVEGVGAYQHQARFATWLYTIARNLGIDHLRKMTHRRHPSLDEPGETGESLGDQAADPHPRASAERSASGVEIQRRVALAVEALPEEQREVFLLRQIGELPFQEIAGITGAPENTVKSRMRYALERLQESLGEYEEMARALR
jgi:RNA polymerase sigma-70 factor (ECF subfamily)